MRSRIRQAGMQLSLDGTLATRPGSIHFHIKSEGKSGTLEYTVDPRHGASLSFHANRYQPWIDDAIEVLRTACPKQR